MDLKTGLLIVTSSIGVLGFCLSVYNTWTARREKRPRIQVSVAPGYIDYDVEEIIEFLSSKFDSELVVVTVANHGQVPVTVDAVMIWLADGTRASGVTLKHTDELPHQLPSGQKMRSYTDTEELRGVLGGQFKGQSPTLVAVCRDQLDRRYTSTPFTLGLH